MFHITNILDYNYQSFCGKNKDLLINNNSYNEMFQNDNKLYLLHITSHFEDLLQNGVINPS